MLQNAYLFAKIGADTAENERNFAENLLNLPKIGNYPTGSARRRSSGRPRGAGELPAAGRILYGLRHSLGGRANFSGLRKKKSKPNFGREHAFE